MNRFTLFAVLLTLLYACKDKENCCDTGEEKIYFTGLTTIDEQGQSLGQADTTDWRFDDVWSPQEADLFPVSSLGACTGLRDSLLAIPMPNPCESLIYLSLITPAYAKWNFRFVDENFEVLKSMDFVPTMPNYNAIVFNTDDFPKDTIRLYYQVQDGNCWWRGHGDILVQ